MEGDRDSEEERRRRRMGRKERKGKEGGREGGNSKCLPAGDMTAQTRVII